MPTGSNFVKNMFMHSGSICIIGLCSYHDPSMSSSCCSHGVFVLFFVITGIEHHHGKHGICNPDLAVNCVKIGINCVQNGNWKEGEQFYDCKNPKVCI